MSPGRPGAAASGRFAKAADYPAADPQVHNLRIGTIHSLCDGLLAEFDTDYMAAGTQLIDEPECVARVVRAQRFDLGYSPGGSPRVIDRLLACPQLVALFRATWETKWPWPSSQMERVALLMGVLNQQVETWFPRCGGTGAANGIEVRHGPKGLTDDLKKLQQRWEEYLDKNQVLDFATVQKRFLKVQPALREKLLHVFVDEFQDNNPIQFAIHTGWLANPPMRLTVVGDDDQVLYRFRGSDLACFADLGPHCHGRKIAYRPAKLEENHSGFTESLFRQALFTELLESHTAPTRRSMDPLDHPLEVVRTGGKYVWPARYWNFLNIFGSYLDNASIDDPEVEAFEEDAVLLLTFHQSKGLEFDHVYVAGTGRPVDVSPALRTKLFSGEAVKYAVDPATGAVTCKDPEVNRLALADREREVYVALTRAKKHLTVLFDPSHEREFLTLNPEIEKLFAGTAATAHPRFSDVEVLEYTP